jgi:hypothetical protein
VTTKTKEPTTAPVPAKPAKKAFLGALADAPVRVAENMTESGLVNINYKVSPDFRKRIKSTANELDISMKSLMEAAFESFLRELKAGQVDIAKLQEADWLSKKSS